MTKLLGICLIDIKSQVHEDIFARFFYDAICNSQKN